MCETIMSNPSEKLNIGKNTVYHVRSGTIDSGKAYEKHLIALYAVRGASSKNEDFSIATNAEVCGDFDDVVIFRKDKESQDEEIFLVQCKHSDNTKRIPLREFLKPKGNYSLEKYANSYGTLIHNSSKNSCYMSTKIQQLKDNLLCILFTNNSVNDDCYPILKTTEHEFLKTQGEVYEFRTEALLGINMEKQLDLDPAFLNQLRLFSDQVNNAKIMSYIAEEINKLLETVEVPRLVLNEIVKKYVLFITEWAQGDLGKHYLLTKAQIIAKLTELLLEKYMSHFYIRTPEKLSDSYNFGIWHSLVQTKKITIIDTNADSDSNVVNFLHHYLNEIINSSDSPSWEQNFTQEEQSKFYQINDEPLKNEMVRTIGCLGTITVLHLYKVLWKLGRIPIVLEVYSDQDFNFIHRVLQLSQFKFRTIVLNKSKCDLLRNQNCKEIFNKLDDLDGSTKELIFEEIVTVQGRSIQLKQLLHIYKPLITIITVRNMIEILKGRFNVGNTFNILPKYFIPRTIPRVLLNTNKLIKALNNSKDLIVVECHSKNFFLNFKRKLKLDIDNLYVTDCSSLQSEKSEQKEAKDDEENQKTQIAYKIIIITQTQNLDEVFQVCTPNTNLNHVVLHDDGHLEWIKTIGSPELIRSCILDATTTSVTISEALIRYANQINIISALPGMGKSLVIDYIAHNTPPNTWVLRINLNQHLDYYTSAAFKCSKENPIKHLEYFMLNQENQEFCKTNEFLAYVLRPCLVLLLFDGLDEISPYHKTEVTEMIKSLLAAKYRMWLTTRPVLKQHVEYEFNAIALSLNPLTKEDQVEFLTKYFKVILDTQINDNKIEEFVLHLLELTKSKLDCRQNFTSIPLHTMLLADAFTAGCRKYISNDGDLKLSERFDLLSLYEHFVQKKLEILAKKYGNYTNKILQSYEEYQQLCALKIVFSRTDLEELQIDSELKAWSRKIKHINELVQKEGIVTSTELTFSHRTFAEYFAGKWLSQNFETTTVQNLIKKLFLRHNIIIRKIFDGILAKQNPLHILLINRQLDEAEELINSNPKLVNDKDAGGRLPCHLAASWGVYHPMPYANELPNPNIHKIEQGNNKMSALLRGMCCTLPFPPKDTIMGFTPLDYAISTDCLANIDAIIATSKIPENFCWEKIKSYRYYSAKYGYQSLIQEILPATNRKQPNFINYVKHNLLNYPHADAKRIDRNGNTLLHIACQFGHIDIVKLLLSHGANLKVSNFQSETPLHLAAQNGFPEITSLLLRNGADIFAKSKANLTALQLATEKGSLETISLLLAYGTNIQTTAKYNSTALHFAVESGSLETVSLLLSNGADIQARAKHGRTVLHLAAEKDLCKITAFLLSKGAEINAKDVHGRTALHQAIKEGALETAKLLITNGADIHAQDDDNMTALHYAAREGALGIMSLLISNGADIHIKAIGSITALHHAAKNGWPKVTSLLLSNGADIHARDVDQMTVLHHAVESGSLETVSVLIFNGADIHKRNEDNMTVLHHAAKKGSIEIASLLITNGADIHAKDKNNMSSLHYAARSGSLEIVSLLICNGAKIHEKGYRQTTALIEAVKNGSTAIVSLLHSKGADVHVQDYYKNNALHLAVKIGSLEMVSFLLTNTLNIHVRDMYNRTALYLAVEKDLCEIVSLLLSKGADVLYRDAYDRTILHVAVKNSSLELVSLLLDSGVDIHAEDKHNRTALHYAAESGLSEIVKLLVSKGACNVIR